MAARILVPLAPPVRSCANVRDLGGYPTPWGPTLAHRFLRCGGTGHVSPQDRKAFRSWGVARVLDLRSEGESPRQTCGFAQVDGIVWGNAALYDYDLSSPTMMPATDTGSYLVSSYLHMLSAETAVRRALSFCAQAGPDECVLFHCAAGMDRTGVLAMLLLGLTGASREDIVADYALSFGTPEQVTAALAARDEPPTSGFVEYILHTRIATMRAVYDTVVATHGSVRGYLVRCGVPDRTLDAVRSHLLGP